MPSFRHISIRRAVPAALVAGMLLTIVPAATMASTPPPKEVRQAEWKVLSYMNQVRAKQGLGPLRMAGGVRLVARDRSRSMKRLDYFGHVSPQGWDAGSTLRNRGIPHAFWGEAIGWTQSMGLVEGAEWMVDWWKRSAPHRRLILRSDFNYAGVGIARDGAKILWTVVFVNQPDHTPPLAGMVGPASNVQVATSNSVTVKWWGKERSRAAHGARCCAIRPNAVSRSTSDEVTTTSASGPATTAATGAGGEHHSGWSSPRTPTRTADPNVGPGSLVRLRDSPDGAAGPGSCRCRNTLLPLRWRRDAAGSRDAAAGPSHGCRNTDTDTDTDAPDTLRSIPPRLDQRRNQGTTGARSQFQSASTRIATKWAV